MSPLFGHLLAGSADTPIVSTSNSIRFISSEPTYFSRTFGTPTNANAYTLSLWIKRAIVSGTPAIFGSNGTDYIQFNGDALELVVVTSKILSTQVYRDQAAWYHIVMSCSGGNTTLYVNNTSVGTAVASSTRFNGSGSTVYIGAAGAATKPFNGLISDVYFVDGQGLTPSSFGELDAYGNWQPKLWNGTFGANGFHLTFADKSSALSTGIGRDFSGNGNNWTPTGVAVSGWSTGDVLSDSPWRSGVDNGAGGQVLGNYATWSSMQMDSTLITPSDCNLVANPQNASHQVAVTNLAFSVGGSAKWYCEFHTGSAIQTVNQGFGVVPKQTGTLSTTLSSVATIYCTDGTKRVADSNSAYGATYSNADTIGVAVDEATGIVTCYKNGVSQGTLITLSAGVYQFIGSGYTTNGNLTINAGQKEYMYPAPSGYKAFCTTNMAPAIDNPKLHMDVPQWTGNGTTQSITGLQFGPGLVIVSSRSTNLSSYPFDVVRGVNVSMPFNTSAVESTLANHVTAFNSDGFAVGTSNNVNQNTATYLAWCFNTGSSTVTNTSGSITSSVRANTTAGCSIVTYTGTEANATVGHGLGAKVDMMIVRRRGGTNNWVYWFNGLSGTQYLSHQALGVGTSTTFWNSTIPTSTVFSVGSAGDTNKNSSPMLAYCFAAIPGFSDCGVYTGNGATAGPFIPTNFRPALIVIKGIQTSKDWQWYNYKSLGYNPTNKPVIIPSVGGEQASPYIDIYSNGFSIKNTDNAVNGNTNTYVYFAWAEVPFKYTTGR